MNHGTGTVLEWKERKSGKREKSMGFIYAGFLAPFAGRRTHD